MPSYNLRLRLVFLLFICIILWQTMRYFPGLSPFSNKGSKSGWDPLLGPNESIAPIPVDVYYEALCPDSRSFFVKQLLPTFMQAARLVKISLIPYGKATTIKSEGTYTFNCQHGPVECKANKVHACAIAKLPFPDAQAGLLLKYITCMISNNLEPMVIGESCAKEFGLDWDPISECATGVEGSELLARYGEETHSLRPRATFIPTILLAGSQEGQPAILKNLFKEVCKKFESQTIKPAECETSR